jgi:hypothetical protein
MNDPCDKLILAEGLGVRLIYCKNCDVIELEVGAISLRLNPSLRLDRMVSVNNTPSNIENLQSLH